MGPRCKLKVTTKTKTRGVSSLSYCCDSGLNYFPSSYWPCQTATETVERPYAHFLILLLFFNIQLNNLIFNNSLYNLIFNLVLFNIITLNKMLLHAVLIFHTSIFL